MAQQLLASFGTGPRDCTKGPATTSHCLNNTAVECTSDDDCFLDGACRPDANCYFGPAGARRTASRRAAS